MLLDRGARGLHVALQTLPLFRREHVEVGLDHLVQDRQHAGVLPDGGLGVHLGHALRDESGPHLLEQPGKLLQPVGDVAQPLGERRELAGQQPVDRPAGQAGVDQGIPGPVLKHFLVPQACRELVLEQRGIHLVGPRQLVARDPRQLLLILAGEGGAAGPRLAADLVELSVEPMIAELRGADRLESRKLVQKPRGQLLEVLVGL